MTTAMKRVMRRKGKNDMSINQIKLFEKKEVRRAWNEAEQQWYFSIVDVISALTNSANSRRYWSDLKKKIFEESNNIQLYENIVQLKMESSDGKKYSTDAGDMETIFRIIQSVPSPKAEPFKQWLAKVGSERVKETANPELAIARAIHTYRRKGYSDKWINTRIKSINARAALTDAWKEHGVTERKEYAILTDAMSIEWSGMKTKEYKDYKGLKKHHSLRNNMTSVELALNTLAEASTEALVIQENPNGLDENKVIAQKGGQVAKTARDALEKQLGESVITRQNAIGLRKNRQLLHEDELNSEEEKTSE